MYVIMRKTTIKLTDTYKKDITRLYLTENMSLAKIYESYFKQYISPRTFWNYIRKHLPELHKFKNLHLEKPQKTT